RAGEASSREHRRSGARRRRTLARCRTTPPRCHAVASPVQETRTPPCWIFLVTCLAARRVRISYVSWCQYTSEAPGQLVSVVTKISRYVHIQQHRHHFASAATRGLDI